MASPKNNEPAQAFSIHAQSRPEKMADYMHHIVDKVQVASDGVVERGEVMLRRLSLTGKHIGDALTITDEDRESLIQAQSNNVQASSKLIKKEADKLAEMASMLRSKASKEGHLAKDMRTVALKLAAETSADAKNLAPRLLELADSMASQELKEAAEQLAEASVSIRKATNSLVLNTNEIRKQVAYKTAESKDHKR